MSTVLPQQNEIIIKPFVYGSVAFFLGKKSHEDISHKWCVYVRGVNNENISNFVKEVHFILHTSFQNHIRKVDKWPFELYEVGWGEFDIKIKIFLIDETMKPLEVVHSLKLYPSQSHINPSSKRPVVSENYDEIIFVNPKPNIRELLLTKSEPVANPVQIEQNNQDNNATSQMEIDDGNMTENKEEKSDANVNPIEGENKMEIEIGGSAEKGEGDNSQQQPNNPTTTVNQTTTGSVNGTVKKIESELTDNVSVAASNTNKTISAFIPNVSQYFLPVDDTVHLKELEENNTFISKEIENVKNALAEKEKEIAVLIKSIKEFK